MRNHILFAALAGVVVFADSAEGQLLPRRRTTGAYGLSASRYGGMANLQTNSAVLVPYRAFGVEQFQATIPPTVQPTDHRAGENRVRLTVHVPDAGARLWIEDRLMAGRGLERSFVSPPLLLGKYEYTFRVSWMESGRQRGEIRTITVEAGQELTVTFPE